VAVGLVLRLGHHTRKAEVPDLEHPSRRQQQVAGLEVLRPSQR
jgi:hypothetical protein